MTIKMLYLAIVCALMNCVEVLAQNQAHHCYYVEIYETAILGTKSISIDFGKNTSAGLVYKIFDENDKNHDFKNVIAALNYMSSRGWEVVSVYDRNTGKAGTKTVYLLKLDPQKVPKDHIAEVIDKVLSEE